ncbi:hypothetical protein B0T17DRAFT_612916 [Bombardia bombarda]|uniref:Uncharacterized protein n=1 Tax=Bombardia bombarda TaxID=252184 RepID=A0AA40CET3_9PEZI|nr:hypothetical protein B0T17DRAFT_612916 [Bombardia bombarda]
MLSNGRGTVISIGSRNAAFDIPYTCAYSVAKTGLLKLHQNIEAEIGGRGVYSYYLQPGNVDTDILDRPGAVDETSLRHHEDVCHAIETVQRKAKRPSEFVAEACVMLITDADSRLLSGLYVDLDQDVNRILDDLRKGENGECAKRSLYKLKISSLQP